MTKPSDANRTEEIFSETFLPEDMPLDSEAGKMKGEKSIPGAMDNLLKETPAKDWADSKKFALGSSMLGWGLFLMLICIILSLWKPDNELVKSGFEAFKLIVMTILGYIFGSNNTKSD